MSNFRHGQAYKGKHTALYAAWQRMQQRCRPTSDRRKYYFERGIRICPRWNSFENFAADMSSHPGKGWTLDRIDNDGDYEPSNCRWATRSTQMLNRAPFARAARKLGYERANAIRVLSGIGDTQRAIAKKFNVAQMTIYRVLNGSLWA